LKTLRKKHIDYLDAVGDLLFSVCAYDEEDYEKLLVAMKTGSLSATGSPMSEQQIDDLKGTKQFRDRYGKYLRKRLRSPETMRQALDDWFCKYKVTASPGSRPACGRLDPFHQVPLFTHETKDAIENCKEKAHFLSDPLPLEKMCDIITPSPNSKHGLPECLSRRGESKLEAFHDRFAHFANSGMRNSLADCLNLSGTARYNLAIRHKRSLMLSTVAAGAQVDRKNIPAAWEKIPPCYNHSELGYVNNMARAIGLTPPFPNAEQLPPDNGERFFSEHMACCRPGALNVDSNDHCRCNLCARNPPNAAFISKKTTTPKRIAQLTVAGKTATPGTIVRQQASLPQPPQLPQHQVNVGQFGDLNCAMFVHPFPMTLGYPCYPYQHIPAHYFTPAYCCAKYKAWLSVRVGRPPHDYHCETKNSK